MTAFLFLVLLIVVGLVLWFATSGKVSDFGRLMFACALLAICVAVAPSVRWFR